MQKNAGFRVRVERDLRDDFVETCRLHGEQASAVIRDFMAHYVAEHRARFQPDLFANPVYDK